MHFMWTRDNLIRVQSALTIGIRLTSAARSRSCLVPSEIGGETLALKSVAAAVGTLEAKLSIH